MSYEIGIDLVEIKRIEEKLTDQFVERILSLSELNFYQGITDKTRRLTYLAGRFASKEALFKALKKGDKTANYSDFTVLNDEFGAPYFVKNDVLKDYHIKVSISHTDQYATAIVLLEKIE
ncbi:MAG: holo-ACP synthase [Acholeplasma sp.]|jgi:holo-[acyl-carrier protein] synthase|nr:holo-ACP synthase [Acholeplasma sp.]